MGVMKFGYELWLTGQIKIYGGYDTRIHALVNTSKLE